MKPLSILLISKFPPLQGGESVKAFGFVRVLRERGHRVQVVTTAPDCAADHVVAMADGDWDYLRVHSPEISYISTKPQANFIPRYDTLSECLISAAIRAIESAKVDLIVGWYLLPFAFSAVVVGRLTGIPCIVQHAGSDVATLLDSPRYGPMLESIVRGASAVFAYRSAFEYFRGMTCHDVFIHRPTILREFAKPAMKRTDRVIDEKRHVVFFGKVGRGKGLEHLIHAVHGQPFDLSIYGVGEQMQSLRERIEKEAMTNVHVNTGVPPWRVPQIIDAAAAVVVPEDGFGIKGHRSQIPLEAALRRVPAICSLDLRGRYPSVDRALTFVDVRDHEALKSALIELINSERRYHFEDEHELDEICSIEADRKYGEELEAAFRSVLNR